MGFTRNFNCTVGKSELKNGEKDTLRIFLLTFPW